jgi:hypothetical protein
MGADLDLDDLDGLAFAGRNGAHHTWRAEGSAADGATVDEGSARFILYGGGEVRYNPQWEAGGDVIATREFRLAPFRRNPVVLADHDPLRVIGVGTAKIVQDGDTARLEGAVQWDLHESNPTAILIAGQHARGVRKAVSIGFMPGKGSVARTKLPEGDRWRLDPDTVPEWRAGQYYRHPELYEWSSVAVPRDPTALQLQSWALASEDPQEQIRRAVREVLASSAAEVVLDAVRHDPAIRQSIQAAALLAAPPPTITPPSPLDAWWATRSA